MIDFRFRLKNLRKEAGYSQTALAEKLLVSQDTVSLWELGKSYPDVENLVQLCKLFEVSADFLLGLKDY